MRRLPIFFAALLVIGANDLTAQVEVALAAHHVLC